MTLGVLLQAATAAPASAPRLARFGSVTGTIRAFATDGARYVAYKPSVDSFAVRDDRTGRTTQVPAAKDCDPLGGAVGVFILFCPRTNPGTFLLDTRTGALRMLPGYGSSWDQYAGFTGQMGAYWVQAVTSRSGRQSTFYVNWRNGALKYAPGPTDEEVEPDAPVDLDSVHLRRLGPEQVRIPPAFAEGPFVLRTVEVPHHPQQARLVLRRGGRPPVVLSGCRTGCGSYRLAAQRVSWLSRNAGHGYLLSSRRRLSWPLAVPNGRFAVAQQTAEHVYFAISKPTPTPATIAFDVRWARWPRR